VRELRERIKGADVVVVGSGAGGGMAAYALTRLGVKVLMLEAGRDYDPASDTPMFQHQFDAPLRGAGTPDKVFGYYDCAQGGGWTVPGEPYTSTEGAERFMWFRTRMLGGRTNHWGRSTPRFGPYDFKPASRDGQGVDWPVDYDEMAPWFDRTEELCGVSGADNGLENHPPSSPGIMQPWPGARANELFVKAGCDALGIPCVPHPRMILTRNKDIRNACFYATSCLRGCSIGAAFQTTTSLLPLADRTGLLDIVTDAHVFEVVTGADGKATGVRFIDKTTGDIHEASGKAVVLAASACETAKILLQSQSALHPDGLGNTTGHVGRHLLDTVGTNVRGQFPALEGRPRYNEDGLSTGHLYMPWWLYKEQQRGLLDFTRGYHIEIYGDMSQQPQLNIGTVTDHSSNIGSELKKDSYNYFGSTIGFSGRGEMIVSDKCYMSLDREKKDRFGLPLTTFDWEWSDQELNQVRHMRTTLGELIERLGGRVLGRPWDADPRDAIDKPGSIIHEVGTTRMGFSDRDSVTDRWGRLWETPNVMVADGGVFASNPHKNPTLAMMALAWRNTEQLVTDMG
jgi:choline dehydrogenase-like flavoprotein